MTFTSFGLFWTTHTHTTATIFRRHWSNWILFKTTDWCEHFGQIRWPLSKEQFRCVYVCFELFIFQHEIIFETVDVVYCVYVSCHPHLIGFSRLWKHYVTFLCFFLSSFVCATAHFSLENGLLLPLAIRNTPSHKHSIVSIGVANIISTACWYMPATLWQFRFEYMCAANISYIYAYWNIVTSCWAHVCICIANCLINPMNFLLLNL